MILSIILYTIAAAGAIDLGIYGLKGNLSAFESIWFLIFGTFAAVSALMVLLGVIA